MKNLLFLLLPVVCALVSCKKGPEDPLLSFNTRKARICQPWQMKKSEKTSLMTTRNGSFVSTTHSRVLSSSDSLKSTIVYAGDTTIISGGHYYDCHFFRDQSFLSNCTFHKVNTDTILNGFNPVTFSEYRYKADYDSTFEYATYGFWEFSGGEGETRKKELLLIKENRSTVSITSRIVYVPLDGGAPLPAKHSTTFSETAADYGSIRQYFITALHKDKLVLSRTLDSSYTNRVNTTFPLAHRLTGEERIEFTNR